MISLLRRMPPVGLIPALICGFALTSLCHAQTSKTTGSSSSSASGPKVGFAIESEMMTYSAMDAEASALACGITRNLGATDDKCTPHGMSGPAGGIIVVTSPSSALAEFQIWRTDMSTMTMLTMRATPYCPKAGERAATSSTSLGSTILSMIPAGQALTFAQALLSTTSESAPVEGNILDDTLINDVSGHLRALGIVVVLPDTYMPGSLTTIDQRRSPFMSKFSELLKARVCLDPSKSEDQSTAPGPERNGQVELEKKAIAESIDGFLKGLADSGIAMPPKPASTTTPATASAIATPQPVISHLNAVLRADGLAQEIAAASPDAQAGENAGWFLLSLKALESGGTELKTGNVIRGSKAIFSGGSVGTYSLFRLTGSVVCSGVFFNYSGALESTKIPKMLEQPSTLGSGRLVGGCATSQ